MIQDASRRRVQSARSTTIAGSATAVIISSMPARNTPTPRTASSTSASRRGIVSIPGSVFAIGARSPRGPAPTSGS